MLKTTAKSLYKLMNRNDSMIIAVFITTIYIVFCVYFLKRGWSEFLALPPNSIGDVLAGFFAPLAFFWLFIATLLQRKELSLQREELKETRKVLADQSDELRRQAEESNFQTSIMQENLNVAKSREVYEQFNLEIYFFLRTYAEKLAVPLKFIDVANGGSLTQAAIIHATRSSSISQESYTKIDHTFDVFVSNFEHFILNHGNGLVIPLNWDRNREVRASIAGMISFLEECPKEERFASNGLVIRRVSGIGFEKLSANAERVINMFGE